MLALLSDKQKYIKLLENRVIDLSIHNHLSSIGVVDLHFIFVLDIGTRAIEKNKTPKKKNNILSWHNAMRIQE